jgi:apolipoprotein N-acyltransferase
VIAAGWTTCEFARVHLLVPSPWALSAYAQIEWSALIQLADTSGPFGLSFLIAWANACVAGFLIDSLRPRSVPLYLGGLAAALGAVLIYGEWRLSQPFSDREPVRVAVVQGGVSRHYLRPDERSGEHLTRHLELTRQAATRGARLVFWPEGALDVDLYPLSARSLRVFELGRSIEAELLVGGPRSQATSSGTHHFNSISLLRRGRRVTSYDKVELMPFSESNPLRALLAIGTDHYTPGRRIELLPAEAFSIGTAICSEAMLPGYVRRVVNAGAEILANPSDDHWFGAESASRQQLASSAFRAIENRRYLVRATSTGYSAIIDPTGRVTARSELGTAEVLEGSVRASDVQTPYQSVGDLFAWVALAACAGLSLPRFHNRSAVRRRS